MYFLEDGIIGLRELCRDDILNGYGDWLNDKEVCKYNSHHRIPVSLAQSEEYVSSLSKRSDALVLAVNLIDKDCHIGNISLQQINYIDRQAEIAFLFGNKEYWRRGYATRAARLLINHAFTELGLNRVYFGTSEENIGMQRIGEKLKFTRVGIRRQALYKHGHFVDIYDYDLLREEWTLENKSSGE